MNTSLERGRVSEGSRRAIVRGCAGRGGVRRWDAARRRRHAARGARGERQHVRRRRQRVRRRRRGRAARGWKGGIESRALAGFVSDSSVSARRSSGPQRAHVHPRRAVPARRALVRGAAHGGGAAANRGAVGARGRHGWRRRGRGRDGGREGDGGEGEQESASRRGEAPGAAVQVAHVVIELARLS